MKRRSKRRQDLPSESFERFHRCLSIPASTADPEVQLVTPGGIRHAINLLNTLVRRARDEDVLFGIRGQIPTDLVRRLLVEIRFEICLALDSKFTTLRLEILFERCGEVWRPRLHYVEESDI